MANKFEYLALQSIDSSTITGTYQTLGSPLSDPGTLVKIINDGDGKVFISTDGTTDHDVLPSNSYTLYGEGPDSFPAQTQFYIKGTPPQVGNVYIVTLKVT